MKKIELLSPARDLETGKAAVNHGADAVYIGGPQFGARFAAANTLEDIERLASYAHKYWARVYLALNTVLFDSELEDAASLARNAFNAGVDALIVQDMAFLEMDLPPIPLIASTQMNNSGKAHVKFLENAGFMRVILARELALDEIRDIRKETTVELEVFVHGALCVGLSGRCYLSASIGSRSANRGMCAQPCRLAWTLRDASGDILMKNRYLLSLKDMDRSEHIQDLLDAGVTSFKIEGRLKDVSYVKNITALYRKKIDQIIESSPGTSRASSGKTILYFEPDAKRTFYRGATSYFSKEDISSPSTAKSTGELLGPVDKTGVNCFTFIKKGISDSINNGDGLCFFNTSGDLRGMQVIKTIDGRVLVHSMPEGMIKGTLVYRNHDHRFLKLLEGETAKRKISIDLTFTETPHGFEMKGTDEDSISACIRLEARKEPANKPETAKENIRKQLSKLGDTLFTLKSLDISSGPYFLSTSQLNALRRDLTAMMEAERIKQYSRPLRKTGTQTDATYPEKNLDYSFNVTNELSRGFYLKHGVKEIVPGFEIRKPGPGAAVMTTRLCLRKQMNACPKKKGHIRLKEPLLLENSGRLFGIRFECSSCRMEVFLKEEQQYSGG